MMTASRAIDVAEEHAPTTYDGEYLEAWQFLVDSRLAWQLQGWFGRMASCLIEDGLIRGEENEE